VVLALSRFCGCAVDSFQRLNAWFWLAAVLLIATASCQRADAETIAATNDSYAAGTAYSVQTGCSPFPPASYVFPSIAAACASISSDNGVRYANGGCTVPSGFSYAPGSPSGSSCRGTLTQPPYSPNTNAQGGFAGSGVGCPNGGTLTGSTCVKYSCPSTGGWTLSGTNCTRPDCPSGQTPNESGDCNCPPSGTPIPGGVYGLPGKHTSLTFCAGTCELTAGGGRSSGQSPNGDWFTEWYGPFSTTGVSDCTQPSGQNGPQDAPRCPIDQCMGEVNGVQVCVACTNRDTDHPPGTRDTDSTQPGQPGTSTTETTTTHTECGSTGCTTTTTTTIVEQPLDENGNPSGPPRTTVRTETEPSDGTEMGEYCEKNPSAPMCVKSSFGGACGAFSCEGDAVQCAIAQEQHNRNCELLTDTGDLARADAVAAFNSESAEFDKSTLTTTTPLDSISGQTLYASALSDQTYTIHGQSITIPFSSLVDYLSYAGLAFMIVCGMVSVRIFSTVLG